MARIATRPLNEQAVKEANNDFYRSHPEMVQDGKRIPIDPCNPAHARYQKEWMDSYENHGGETRKGQFKPPCGSPVEPCPCNGSLRIIVEVIRPGSPEVRDRVPNAEVRVLGPTETSGQTGMDGTVSLTGLEAGLHLIDVATLSGEYGTENTVVECHNTTEVYIKVEAKTKTVALKWLRKTMTSRGTRRSPGGKESEVTTRSWSDTIIEEYVEVQEDYELIDYRSHTLFHKSAGLIYPEKLIERSTGTYGIKSTGRKIKDSLRDVVDGTSGEYIIGKRLKFGLEESPNNRVYESWEEAQKNMQPDDFAELQKYR